MEYFIRNMSKTDLNEVVQLHIKTFPDFFLTSLGNGFLYELYRDFLHDDFSICKIAEKNGRIKGFVVGSLQPNILFRKMLFYKGYLFLFYAFKALIKNPIFVFKKLLYAIKYRGDQPSKIINAALLISIGVASDSYSKGIGSVLVKEFCKEVFSKGAKAIYLTTDKFNNDHVNSFYIKNGFQLESEIIKTNGRIMNRYIKFSNETNF